MRPCERRSTTDFLAQWTLVCILIGAPLVTGRPGLRADEPADRPKSYDADLEGLVRKGQASAVKI
jgi:hypothetical protein